jgi:hypothetical protein
MLRRTIAVWPRNQIQIRQLETANEFMAHAIMEN